MQELKTGQYLGLQSFAAGVFLLVPHVHWLPMHLGPFACKEVAPRNASSQSELFTQAFPFFGHELKHFPVREQNALGSLSQTLPPLCVPARM